MSGWVKLYRSLLDWEWYRDIPVRVVFEHLLLTANFEETNFQGQIVPRGSVILTLSKLAADTGLSMQQVRTALKKLQSTNEITSASTNKFQVITVVNYDLYQANSEEATSTSTNTLTNDTPSNKQITRKSTNRSTNEQHAETVGNKESGQIEYVESNTQNNKQKSSTATNEQHAFKESKNQEYNNIYNNTPLTPQEEEREEKVPVKVYAFEGEFVKLNDKDFNRWKKSFPNVELEGFLTSYDAWLKTQPEKVQKDWFMRCAGYLAKKNQENSKNETSDKSQTEESIWDVYDRLGISYKKPEEQ